MSDPKISKGTLLPLSHSPDHNAIRGLYTDETGTCFKQYTAMQEGQPIMGEITSLIQREGSSILDVETTHLEHSHHRANSDAYRDGWERIFGKNAAEA